MNWDVINRLWDMFLVILGVAFAADDFSEKKYWRGAFWVGIAALNLMFVAKYIFAR
jgi:hypothetical protein